MTLGPLRPSSKRSVKNVNKPIPSDTVEAAWVHIKNVLKDAGAEVLGKPVKKH